MVHGARQRAPTSPIISALALGDIFAYRGRTFRPPMTSQKQKQPAPLNQQIEAR